LPGVAAGSGPSLPFAPGLGVRVSPLRRSLYLPRPVCQQVVRLRDYGRHPSAELPVLANRWQLRVQPASPGFILGPHFATAASIIRSGTRDASSWNPAAGRSSSAAQA